MDTKYLVADDRSIKEAAQLLTKGEVVAIPTETVYGLGADATNELAVNKVFKAKERPNDNPLIVHVANKEQLFNLVKDTHPYVEKLINIFSPGPITYILNSNGKVAPNVTAGLKTVGVRIPDNQVTLRLLSSIDFPIAAPSANTSGKPSPTIANHVLDDLHGKIAAVLDGGKSKIGVESTVIDCTAAVPVILRLGMITADDIQRVAGSVNLVSTLQSVEKPKSPGLKYKHYAPEVPLVLVKDRERLQEVIDSKVKQGKRISVVTNASSAKKLDAESITILGDSEEEAATKLYDVLRSFKKEDIDVVICDSLSTTGIGKAVMDRIERAADIII